MYEVYSHRHERACVVIQDEEAETLRDVLRFATEVGALKEESFVLQFPGKQPELYTRKVLEEFVAGAKGMAR